MRRIFFAGAVLALSMVGPSARAEWPNLNPFRQASSSQPAKKSPYTFTDESPASDSTSTSSWLPKMPTPPSPTKAWQSVKTGTSNAYNKTKSTLAPLNPWSGSSSGTQKSSMWGSQNKQASSGGSWIPNWMMPYDEEPKGPPTTVHDWLSSDRPE